ncbi:hypothetical protein PRIC1_003250 [Phytophthora ramorum]
MTFESCGSAASVDVDGPKDEEESDASDCGVKCAECGEWFEFVANLNRHGRETRHQPFGCHQEGCTKRYSKQEHLARHLETVHVRDPTQSLEERKPFKCELCVARFTYKHALTRHMKRSHRNVNVPFECTECLMAFKKKSELLAHSYAHTGVLPFECADCGERFPKRFLLSRHRRKHVANEEADTEVCVCECGEICFDEEELRTHNQTEHSKVEVTKGIADGTPEQPTSPALVCLVCDQTFSRKQYLRAHLRTHFESLDDRKQFTCPMEGCNKAYTRSSNLMAHYNAVHDELKSKRFACPREDCSARFGYKTVLKHHIESIHDNPKPRKRSERKSVGILQRVLGLNQVGKEVMRGCMLEGGEAKPIADDEEKKVVAVRR